jgi:hypothetical protein
MLTRYMIRKYMSYSKGFENAKPNPALIIMTICYAVKDV